MNERKKPTLTVQTSVLGRASPPCEICLQSTSFVLYAEVAGKRVGRFAHIRAVKDGGPRFDQNYPKEKVDSPENLFWCCTDCHDIVDKTEVWTLERLLATLEEHRASGAAVKLLVVEGEINVFGENAENVTGIDAGGKPTVLKPGTSVNVSGKDTRHVTGIKN